MTNAIRAALDATETRTAAEEREAVVKWLRDQADKGLGDEGPGALYNAADAIERGDHLK